MALLRRIPIYKIHLMFYNGLPDNADTAPDGSLAFNISSASAPTYVKKSGVWSESTTGATGVSSVFGRTGIITAQANDYSFAQISGRATVAQLATGTPDGTKFVRDDGTLAVPPGSGGSPATASALGTVKISGTPTDAANPVAYVKEQTDTLLAGKAASSHTHGAADIASGTLALGRIPTGTTSSTVAFGDAPANAVAAHVGLADPHTQYALDTDLSTGLAGKASTTHASTHASAGSDPVTPAAIGAAATVHTHAAADVTSGTLATARIPHVGVRTTANVALSASTTINLTALDLTVASGDVWVLDYFIPATVSGGTAGLKPIFTLPASSTGTMDVSGTVASVTGYSYTHSTTPGTAAAVAFMTASFTGYLYVRAVLTMGGAGTCRIGVTTGASAAGNLLAGCSVLAMKL